MRQFKPFNFDEYLMALKAEHPDHRQNIVLSWHKYYMLVGGIERLDEEVRKLDGYYDLDAQMTLPLVYATKTASV